MNPSNSPWQPLQAADIEWQNRQTPYASKYGDIYFSAENGLQESRYVFIDGNNLPQRWQQHRRASYCIAETGFGTGLNLLATWQAWLQQPQPRPSLHYIAFELHPLRQADLQQALGQWPELADLAAQLLAAYPGLVPGLHRLHLADGQLIVDLYWGQAQDWLQDLAQQGRKLVDSWYLDGFAPAKNETLWHSDLFTAAAQISRDRASFATFTAAGAVKRGLQAAGFDVYKAPGYGRKRECLRGELTSAPPAAVDNKTPWERDCRKKKHDTRTAIVLGAGLAGCWTAHALASRGIKVELVEKNTLACAGSGNAQGILYTRLSARHSSLTDFAVQSFIYASKRYQLLFESRQLRTGTDGELCGSFHFADIEDLSSLTESLAETPELAQALSAAQARELLQINVSSAGFWFPQSGWLNPAAVCTALVDHPNISLRENCGDTTLQAIASGWTLTAESTTEMSADIAVIATGVAANDQPSCDWLPLKPVRGQTTEIPTGPWSDLTVGLCHQGYIAPARNGTHTIGATFAPGDDDLELRPQDNSSNIEQLAQAVPAWAAALQALPSASLPARASQRCASPDYLPLVGPVPDFEAFLQRYSDLRKNAKRVIPEPGSYMPGLYLNTAHGSRGLSSTPLAAELLAAQICDQPLPLSRQQQRALAPARFLIRDLIRKKR